MCIAPFTLKYDKPGLLKLDNPPVPLLHLPQYSDLIISLFQDENYRQINYWIK